MGPATRFERLKYGRLKYIRCVVAFDAWQPDSAAEMMKIVVLE